MPLEPLIRTIYQAAAEAGPTPPPANPAERREQAAALAAMLWQVYGLPVPEVEVENHLVPVDGAPDVQVRVHRPGGAAPATDTELSAGADRPVGADRSGGAEWPGGDDLPRGAERLRPALVSFFGGAFRQGGNDFDANRWTYATRCIEADVVVVAVDYALAPEDPFPAQLLQACAALDWVRAHAEDLGVDPARIAIGGQSSGANLAAALVQANLDGPRHPIALQILEVPTLDLTGGHLDFTGYDEIGMPEALVRADFDTVVADYLPAGGSVDDPRVSPLLREDLTGTPRTLVLACEYDPLRGDARAYHARLREAGVEAALFVAAGLTHESIALVGALEAARVWNRTVVAALRDLHA